MSLLFVVFGRKIRDKDYGPAYPTRCPRCHNDVFLHAYKWRSWFHVFWIPLVPWFSHGELVCPICQEGLEVEPDEFKEAKALVGETQQYRERQSSEHEYAKAIHEFETTASFVEEPVEPEEFLAEIAETEVEEREIDQPPSD